VRLGQPPEQRCAEAASAEVAVVDLVLLHGEQAVLELVDRHNNLVDIDGAVPAVVRVALEHDPLVDDSIGEVVGA
jgi:uncharacterized protein YceH (UPF0502 family)